MTIESLLERIAVAAEQLAACAALQAAPKASPEFTKPPVDEVAGESYAQKRKAEIAAEAKAKKEAELAQAAQLKAEEKAKKEEGRRHQEELRAAEAAKKAAAAEEPEDDFLAPPAEEEITLEQVREVMIKLRTAGKKDVAFTILSKQGNGASLLPGSAAVNTTTPPNAVLKAENFRAVYEAGLEALK